MTRVLVTGAAGFVGANVLFELSRRPNVTPVAMVRPGGSLAPLSKVETITADLADATAITNAVNRVRPDVIINAAAYGVLPGQTDPARTSIINLHAVETLLAAGHGAGIRRLVQLGSYFEYGDQVDPLRENGPLSPKNVYAETKAAATGLVAGQGAVNAVVLRLFNVWGRWESPTRLVPQIINACRTKTTLALTAGTQRKDFVYAGDAAAWICDLALRPDPPPHRIVNLASGEMVAVKDFARAIAEELGHPELLQFGAKPLPATEPQSGPADTTRIDSLLPNRRKTPLKEALAEMMRSP